MATHRVLIDGYFMGKASGFGRFIFELCRALGTAESCYQFFVSVPRSVDEAFLKPYDRLTYIRIPDVTFPVWEQIMVPLCARMNRCDIIHFPYNTRALATVGARVVTTVHDLTFMDRGAERNFKSAVHHLYCEMMFRIGSSRSAAVISVSDTTKAALLEHGVTSQRIYNTVDGFLKTETSQSLEKPVRPYFLHRGGYATGHRNTERIIQAFLSVQALTDAYDLKILGAPRGAERWNTTANKQVQYLQAVSDSELALIYAQSSCVVAASLLEGFCFPIIEAFGFGAPVIASDLDPMKEIAGDAALLVDPTSVEDIAKAMLRMVSDDWTVRAFVTKGRRRLAAFGSQSMAEQHLALYRHILEL